MSDIGHTEKNWKGILPIVSVPFDETGELDLESFEHTLDYIEGTDAFAMMLFGIASEFYKLSDAEKEVLTSQYLNTHTKTKKLISITEHATKLAVQRAVQYEKMGSDGLMLLPPFFLNPSKQEIIHHIERVVESVSIPVLLQIATGETGISFTKEELFDLHVKFPNLYFKIEGNPAPIELIHNLIEMDFNIKIYNGYAGIFMTDMLEVGCSGIMPGCSFVEVYTKIYDLFKLGKDNDARDIHKGLCDFILPWMCHCEYIIKIEKLILQKRGVIASDHCRAPSYLLSDQDKNKVANFFESYSDLLR